MSDLESAKQALEAVASNPKVTSAVSAATGGMGVAAILSSAQTILGIISLVIGCLVGLFTLRSLHIKNKILQRMERDGESFTD